MGDLWVTYGRPMGDLWATYGEDTVEEWDVAGINRKVAYRICVYCISDLRILCIGFAYMERSDYLCALIVIENELKGKEGLRKRKNKKRKEELRKNKKREE